MSGVSYFGIDTKTYLDYSARMSVETLFCAADDGHTRNGSWSRPLIVKLRGKKRLPEIMESWAGDVLVREDKIGALQGLSGFQLKEAFLEHPSGWKDVPRYLELDVTGFGGVLSRESGLAVEARCAVCQTVDFSVAKRFRFQVPEGSGQTDVFRVWPILSILYVSRRFVEAFSLPERPSFTPIEEVSFPGNSYSPPRLSDYYERERAEEIEAEFKAAMDSLAAS
jgi:hypothetical protein